MNKKSDDKVASLQEQGALNPHPEGVRSELFQSHEFFDARDLVQVKYEMLRRVQVEGKPVTEAAAAFGLSRPTFYQAQEAMASEGLPGLLPERRGPRAAHKLTDEVVAFLQLLKAKSKGLRAYELAQKVQERFGFSVHPRSIERALSKQEKKRVSS